MLGKKKPKKECPKCGKRKFVATEYGMKCLKCGFVNLNDRKGKQLVTDFKTGNEVGK